MNSTNQASLEFHKAHFWLTTIVSQRLKDTLALTWFNRRTHIKICIFYKEDLGKFLFYIKDTYIPQTLISEGYYETYAETLGQAVYEAELAFNETIPY